MTTEQIIDYLVDNEDKNDLKIYLKGYFKQIEIAKKFIYAMYHNEETGEWDNSDFEKVYYYLDFNRKYVELTNIETK